MVLYQSIGGVSSLIGVLLPLGTVTAVLRFIARYKQKGACGPDDFLIIPAWMCFLGLSTLAIYGMVHGFIGVSLPKDPAIFLSPAFASTNIAFVKVYWIAGLLSVLAVGFTRLSALFFYRRVFVTGNNKWDVFGITTFVAIVVVVLWMIAFVIFESMICGTHFEWLFNPLFAIQCQVYPFLEGATISSFILDFIVLMIPVPKIYMLHTSSVRKVAISLVFLLAAAGTAASGVRLVLSNRSLANGRTENDKDAFLSNTTLLYFMLLEAGFCLVAINLPSLWYFVSKTNLAHALESMRSLLSRRLGSSAGSKQHMQYDHGKDASSLASSQRHYESDKEDASLASHGGRERRFGSQV